MPIRVACPGCGRRFKAPDRAAGRKTPCPACQTPITIPLGDAEDDEDEYRLADEPPRGTVVVPEVRPAKAVPRASDAVTGPQQRDPPPPAGGARPTRAWVPATTSSTPTWLRHLHWCLALATIPLAVTVFMPRESDEELAQRIVSSFTDDSAAGDPAVEDASGPQTSGSAGDESAMPPEIDGGMEDGSTLGQMTLDDLLMALPGHKVRGALLSRDSRLHWAFALVAAIVYFAFLLLLASDQCARPLHLLGVGLFTATGGILLLLFVQLAASLRVVRVRGAAALVMLVLALIGMSYRCALDPESGLVASFMGFTLGVGLCEEICKALPLLFLYRMGTQQNWRGAFLWGMASGMGFGVSEGIMYSHDFYNGIAGPSIYVVRFVSCVALHAIWAGSIGISINQRQDLLEADWDEWWWYLLAVLRLIAVPMVLHGLYDTLLKKEYESLALLTAAASFGYLAWQISHLRQSDDEDERAAFVTEYIRAKAATQPT